MSLQQGMITVIPPSLAMPAYSPWDHKLTSTAAKPLDDFSSNAVLRHQLQRKQFKVPHADIYQQRMFLEGISVLSVQVACAGSLFRGHCLREYKVLNIFHLSRFLWDLDSPVKKQWKPYALVFTKENPLELGCMYRRHVIKKLTLEEQEFVLIIM